MTLLATHTQESLLQPSALEIRVKLLLHEIRERPVGRGAQLTKCGIVLLDELVQQCPFRPVALSPLAGLSLARRFRSQSRQDHQATLLCAEYNPRQ
jgi:hypothetical protein